MLIDIKDERQTGDLQTKISNIAQNYISNYRLSPDDIRKHKIIKRLQNNKNLVITRPDKGSGTVILDKVKYMNELRKIVSNTEKFKKLEEDPTLKRERSLQNF